ncbi:MAG: recombinase family protein [Defluviitaleaceae bacterium]|nr:recombinase family protein [Defluviitaleaceae bacterium]
MSKVYGYARCSTHEGKQDVQRQRRELREFGATDIYMEYESGVKIDRPELRLS